jgi:hypothetical protein
MFSICTYRFFSMPSFFFDGGNFKRKIQRAEADGAGQDKYDREYAQYKRNSPGNVTGHVKNANNDSQQYSDSSVDGSHIFFHMRLLSV